MKWLLLLQLSIGGTVVSSETGQPLGFSVVTLIPPSPEVRGGQGVRTLKRFTDSAGTFAFSGLPPGTYLLSVRQIAYAPLDTQLTLAHRAITLRLALRHLAIELPPVTIHARPRCTNPGPPDRSATPALAAVFDQLQEHARRFALLADSFPFEYRLEQTLRQVNRRGDTLRPTVDTLRLTSRSERPYEVGRVVGPGWAPWRSELLVHTPTLQDFGNPSFVKSHCFHLVGLDTIHGRTLVRLDFEPSVRISWADMAGSAYLDSLTYQLYFTESSLTHPERSELANVASMVSRTRFRDVARGIPLQDSLHAVTTYRFAPRQRLIETQRTIDVRFRRPSSQ